MAPLFTFGQAENLPWTYPDCVCLYAWFRGISECGNAHLLQLRRSCEWFTRKHQRHILKRTEFSRTGLSRQKQIPTGTANQQSKYNEAVGDSDKISINVPNEEYDSYRVNFIETTDKFPGERAEEMGHFRLIGQRGLDHNMLILYTKYTT